MVFSDIGDSGEEFILNQENEAQDDDGDKDLDDDCHNNSETVEDKEQNVDENRGRRDDHSMSKESDLLEGLRAAGIVDKVDQTSQILPESSQMMIHDGEEYVTIVQDGQTYAIPLSEYQSMQPGGTITIQVMAEAAGITRFPI